jgi:hypothetical protein
MPRRDYREKHRKKTRYSSDSSDTEREKSAQRYSRERGRVRSKTSREKSSKYNKRDSSTRSTSSSSSSRGRGRSSSNSSSSSSSSSNNDRKTRGKNVKEPKKQSSTEQPPTTKTFDLEDLYKDKDKNSTKVLDEIEAETFKQSNFQSQKKILVDLEKDKILVPSTSAACEEESLISPNFLGDDSKRVDKWIKKLYLYRANE